MTRLNVPSRFRLLVCLGTIALGMGTLTWQYHSYLVLQHAATPFVRTPIAFKIQRADNRLEHYIEDLVFVQVSADLKTFSLLRHLPEKSLLEVPIENAHLTDGRLCLETHWKGNRCRIYLGGGKLMIQMFNNDPALVAIETGMAVAPDEVKLFYQDPLCRPDTTPSRKAT